jgi:dipeptidase D
MSNTILELQPQELWAQFHSLTLIPRPSGHEERIREFVACFGRGLGLDTLVDEAGNVLIRKPATEGMERRKGVVLQGHLDMVPQKNSGTFHDFERDPIETVVDGEWVCAKGTTLGADNGTGVAAIMAVLASAELPHGPLEALFTSNEEAGMTGARGLTPGVLKGEILMNLDSEDEGELFIGCAGGTNAKSTFVSTLHPLPQGFKGFSISVTGLRGGHSGLDIHLGRGNANKIMNRTLFDLHRYCGVRLSSIEGGSLPNAIPRESFAVIAVPVAKEEEFLNRICLLEGTIKDELYSVEPTLKIEALPAEVPETVIDEAVFLRFLTAVYACPNGVMQMDQEMQGLVETSNNLAMVKSGSGEITVECLLRSSVDSQRVDMERMINAVFDLAGAVTVFDGGYPGWKPNPDSEVLKFMQAVYMKKFGNLPLVRAVHAGLECGILGASYPDLEMISFGPTIRYPHSPDEKVHIDSVRKFWEFLVDALQNVPAQIDDLKRF